MKIVKKIIQIIIALAIIGGLIFYFEKDIKSAFNNATKLIDPCGQPINYSLGNFDKKFGLSQDDFIKIIGQAAEIWQKPLNKKLFNLTAGGALKINLIYDARQQSTDRLKALGLSIHKDKASYETLKNKYNSLETVYLKQKSELENTINYYNQQKADYEDEVKAANRHGGVSPDRYAILEQERISLNNLAEPIRQKQDALNKTVADINALATVINKLIRELNLSASDYNAIGAATSGEFKEGEYVSDVNGERINIYQFDDKEALVRVLAHELGHALGLEHSDNPKAIMYRLNEDGNDKITADDLTALKQACKIK
jgi:predicted Zn-dependent protease